VGALGGDRVPVPRPEVGDHVAAGRAGGGRGGGTAGRQQRGEDPGGGERGEGGPGGPPHGAAGARGAVRVTVPGTVPAHNGSFGWSERRPHAPAARSVLQDVAETCGHATEVSRACKRSGRTR